MKKLSMRLAVPVCVLAMAFSADAYSGPASGPGPDDKELILLKRDLVIPGPNAANGAELATIGSVQVDDQGRIIIMDGKDLKVKVFGADGSFIRSFGTKGQGPGEFQSVLEMFLKNGVISVFDFGNNRVSRFSVEGRHIEDVDLRAMGGLSRVEGEDGAAVYSNKLEWQDESARLKLLKFDKKTGKMSVMSTSKAVLSFSKIEPLADQFILLVRSDGKLIWTDPGTYELFVDAPDGRKLGRITHSCAKVKVTEEEKAAFIKRVYGDKPPDIELIWPEYHSPIDSVTLDDKDRLFVGTAEKDREGRRKYDVFDAAGKFLGSFHVRNAVTVVKNGFLYAKAEDADGFPIVERYVMTWGR